CSAPESRCSAASIFQSLATATSRARRARKPCTTSSRVASAASPIAIRLATVADAESLAGLARQTFSDTFAPDNSPEDLALHLERAFTPSQQARELADPAVRTLLLHVGPTMAAYAQLRIGPAPECVASAL